MKFAKPHIYFWITGLMILLLTLIIYKSDDEIVINVHDTYFIIAYSHLGKIFSFLFTFIGLIYFLSKKIKLHKFLTTTHTLISIGCFIFYIIGQLYYNFKPVRKNSNFPLFDDLSNKNIFLSFIFFLFVLVQLLLLINLVLSLVKLLLNRKK